MTMQNLVEKEFKAKNQATETAYCRCGELMREYSFCIECRNVAHLGCKNCGFRTLGDVHEFCYCQLELYSMKVQL